MSDSSFLDHVTGSSTTMAELKKNLRQCTGYGVAAGGITALMSGGNAAAGLVVGGMVAVGCLSSESVKRQLDQSMEKISGTR